MNRIFYLCIILSAFVRSNEISFNEVTKLDDDTIHISFLLEKVSFLKSYSLLEPSRLVIDVYDSELNSAIDEVYNFPVKKIRATSEGNLTRIVVDLYEYVKWKKPTQINTKDGVLLVLEIHKAKKLKNNIRDIVIAIDAGHGGRDPGAVGKNVEEKDITLLIARELQRTLRDTFGYQAVMIRENDESVSLNQRYQNARKSGADALISIHADGFRLESVKGASVFIWADEASSSVARNLSEKQRRRIQAQIKDIKPYDFNEDEAKMLYPNTYKNKIDQSFILGTKILDQLKRDPFTKIHKKNVESADFRVLKSVDIPSVLVESGFITNPEDAERLTTKKGRRMIARSIFLGIHNYFLDQPLSGTLLENNQTHVTYKVQEGDTISELAIRFGVTAQSIRQTNNLKSNSIFQGQEIRINLSNT
tara:strand:+ start:351 stop:1610 length:1260 start_codon:yes stop_codon:yes gene_type:complete